MRIGAPVFCAEKSASAYVRKLNEKRYRAAYCPDYLSSSVQEKEIRELKQALSDHDIVLAEVGAWSNPLSPDAETAQRAKAYLIDRLRLADALGAACCVNVMGSVSAAFWYAPAADNYTERFRERCVEIYQEIIDAVKPVHTKMAFEVMPYCFLDCAEEYARFLERLDRPQAAVHLDLVNLIHDPRTLFAHRHIFKDAVSQLGGQCVSAHIKDIAIEATPPNTCLNEVPMGEGEVDVKHMIQCLSRIPGDLPVLLEHLPDEKTYDRATRNFVRAAREAGVDLIGGFA